MYGPNFVTTLLASAMDSQPNPLAFLAWFGCLCGIYIFGQGLFMLRRARRERMSAVSTIRDAGPGLLHVGGLTEGDPTLLAAVSGKSCFYYRATVWRQEDSTQDDAWEKAAEETMSKPFVLNDTTGRILVDPGGAEVDMPRDTHEEYGKTLLATHTDIPARLEDFLTRNKVDTRTALRVEEYLIPLGAEVFVYGMKTKNSNIPAITGVPAPTMRAASSKSPAAEPKPVTQQIIHLSSNSRTTPAAEMTMQSRLAAALTLARGTTSEARSTETRSPLPLTIPSISVSVEERVEETKTQGALVPPPLHTSAPKMPPPPFVLRQSQDDSPFTISYRSQDTADSSSSRRAIALLAVGPLLSLASTYCLFVTFGWL